jgi:hypothetical protein
MLFRMQAPPRLPETGIDRLTVTQNTRTAHHLASGGSAGIASDRIFPASEYPLPTLFLL